MCKANGNEFVFPHTNKYKWQALASPCLIMTNFTVYLHMYSLDQYGHCLDSCKFIIWGAYHLDKTSRNFGLKSDGKVIFRSTTGGTPQLPNGISIGNFHHLKKFPFPGPFGSTKQNGTPVS